MSDEALQLVTFHLGNEEFGMDIKKVQEINRMIDITKIPNAPPYVEGVVNLRGKIIPIVSLRTKLGLFEADRDKATRIMVVEIDGSILGFIVDLGLDVAPNERPLILGRAFYPPPARNSTQINLRQAKVVLS